MTQAGSSVQSGGRPSGRRLRAGEAPSARRESGTWPGHVLRDTFLREGVLFGALGEARWRQRPSGLLLGRRQAGLDSMGRNLDSCRVSSGRRLRAAAARHTRRPSTPPRPLRRAGWAGRPRATRTADFGSMGGRSETGRAAALSGRNLHPRSTRRPRGGLAATAPASAGGAHRDSESVGTGEAKDGLVETPRHPRATSVERAARRLRSSGWAQRARTWTQATSSEAAGGEGRARGERHAGGLECGLALHGRGAWQRPGRTASAGRAGCCEGHGEHGGRFGGGGGTRARATWKVAVASAAAGRREVLVPRRAAVASAAAVEERGPGHSKGSSRLGGGRTERDVGSTTDSVGTDRGLRHAERAGRGSAGEPRDFGHAATTPRAGPVRGPSGRTGRVASAARHGARGRCSRLRRHHRPGSEVELHRPGSMDGRGRGCLRSREVRSPRQRADGARRRPRSGWSGRGDASARRPPHARVLLGRAPGTPETYRGADSSESQSAT